MRGGHFVLDQKEASMRITESNVCMTAQREYVRKKDSGTGQETVKEFRQSFRSDTYLSGKDNLSGENWNLNYEKPKSVNSVPGIQTKEEPVNWNEIRSRILKTLMERMAGAGNRTSGSTVVFANQSGIASSSSAAAMMTQRMVTFEEYEYTGFAAKGYAKTEDGRCIDFGVELQMSRSYMEYTDIQIPILQNLLADPLVINVSSHVTKIADQTFRFDLDADGKEDDVSMLGSGSGFLALDKNGDGRINDGNELFGAKSGDGFADLREYDEDGNGWIDENDAVFRRLKVWCKAENGEDILMDLKQADVGAIYLGEQGTEFTMKTMDGNRNGVVRSTGIFLKESGGVGTIQHVDLAIHGEEGRMMNVQREDGLQKEEEPDRMFEKIRMQQKDRSDQRQKNRQNEKRNERRREEEARQIRRREQQKLLEEQFEKRKTEHRELLEQSVERQFIRRKMLAAYQA